MLDLFTNFWFLLFGMTTVIVVVLTVSIAWGVTRQSLAVLNFKKEMIQRGMSAEEIERVMVASAEPVTGVDGDSLAEIVSVLAEYNGSPTIIEQVLCAFRAVDVPTQRLVSIAIQSLIASDDGKVEGE